MFNFKIFKAFSRFKSGFAPKSISSRFLKFATWGGNSMILFSDKSKILTSSGFLSASIIELNSCPKIKMFWKKIKQNGNAAFQYDRIDSGQCPGA